MLRHQSPKNWNFSLFKFAQNLHGVLKSRNNAIALTFGWFWAKKISFGKTCYVIGLQKTRNFSPPNSPKIWREHWNRQKMRWHLLQEDSERKKKFWKNMLHHRSPKNTNSFPSKLAQNLHGVQKSRKNTIALTPGWFWAKKISFGKTCYVIGLRKTRIFSPSNSPKICMECLNRRKMRWHLLPDDSERKK